MPGFEPLTTLPTGPRPLAFYEILYYFLLMMQKSVKTVHDQKSLFDSPVFSSVSIVFVGNCIIVVGPTIKVKTCHGERESET